MCWTLSCTSSKTIDLELGLPTVETIQRSKNAHDQRLIKRPSARRTMLPHPCLLPCVIQETARKVAQYDFCVWKLPFINASPVAHLLPARSFPPILEHQKTFLSLSSYLYLFPNTLRKLSFSRRDPQRWRNCRLRQPSFLPSWNSSSNTCLKILCFSMIAIGPVKLRTRGPSRCAHRAQLPNPNSQSRTSIA